MAAISSESYPSRASATDAGLAPTTLIGSPIVGADGNREFLALLSLDEGSPAAWSTQVDAVAPSPV